MDPFTQSLIAVPFQARFFHITGHLENQDYYHIMIHCTVIPRINGTWGIVDKKNRQFARNAKIEVVKIEGFTFNAICGISDEGWLS